MIGLTYIMQIEGVTGKELADKLGVTPSTISQWEKQVRPIAKNRLPQLMEIFPAYDSSLFQKELSDVDKLIIDNLKKEYQIRTLLSEGNTLAAVQERKNLQNEILKNEALIDQQRVIEAITILFSYLNNGDVNSIRDISLRRVIVNHFIELCNLDNTILANFIKNEYDIAAYDKTAEEIIFNINQFCEELKFSIKVFKNFIDPNPPLPF